MCLAVFHDRYSIDRRPFVPLRSKRSRRSAFGYCTGVHECTFEIGIKLGYRLCGIGAVSAGPNGALSSKNLARVGYMLSAGGNLYKRGTKLFFGDDAKFGDEITVRLDVSEGHGRRRGAGPKLLTNAEFCSQ